MKFNEKEIEFIKSSYRNFGLKFCSNKLNRSISSVQKVATRFGLKVNRKEMIKNNPELLQHLRNHVSKVFQPINEINKFVLDKKELENLYNNGKSLEEIANIYGCSDFVISKFLKHLVKRKAGSSLKHKSKNQYGENNPAWKGGIKDIYNRFRDLSEYYTWRKEVLNRDGNKCTKCNKTEKLHSHHIKTLKSLILGYSIKVNKALKDLTREDLTNLYFYDLSNGLTLCEICHRQWHKENGR